MFPSDSSLFNLLIFFIFFILNAPSICAQPMSLGRQVVSEAAPFVFSPNTLALVDFELVGNTNLVQGRLVSKSFEWTRVSRYSVLPRARAQFFLKDHPKEKLVIQYMGGNSFNDVLVALMSKAESPIIVFDKEGKTEIARFTVRFNPKRIIRKKVSLDSSCSAYGLEILSEKIASSWAYVSCRLVQTESPQGTKPILEMMIYWDGSTSDLPLEVEGSILPAQQLDTPMSIVKLSSEVPVVHLKKGEDEVVIEHRLPAVWHRLLFSMGLGPYIYQLDNNNTHFSKIVPYGTLYMSYLMNESLKFASFWAFPIDAKFQTDIGFYMIVEQFRGVDERLSLNLLLGAHMLQFLGDDQGHFSFSAPQGVEFNIRDCFMRRKSLSIGGFFYPTINGRSYINSWVRWGSGSLFYEFNYISWREPFAGYSVSSKSFGLSVGFPLFRAL